MGQGDRLQVRVVSSLSLPHLPCSGSGDLSWRRQLGRADVRVTEVRGERQVEQKGGSRASLRLEEGWRAGEGGREAGGISTTDR